MAILLLSSISILVIVAGIFYQLTSASHEARSAFGFHFFSSQAWNPVTNVYGSRMFILGTLYSSAIALVISVPISIGAAIFLSEIAPKWLRTPISFLVELLAAIPSVVYGLWGIFVLVPFLVDKIETPISNVKWLARTPFFDGAPNGNDMLAAGLVLSIMITPYITAVSRDIIRAIPRSAREGSYALGSTKWEAIRLVVLPYARAGIIGAVILGLGRALGETMAVTMVCGNSTNPFSLTLFNPGATMASIIANQLGEASGMQKSALIEIGLVLFVVTMVVNAGARLLVYLTARDIQGRVKA